jgi:hypothetical protein
MRGLLSIALVTSALVAPQAAPVATPQAIAGPWETAIGSNIDGIFISTVSNVQSPSTWLQEIQVRLSYRGDGAVQTAWYTTRDRRAEFDGEHLRVAGLDVRLQVDPPRWTGTWLLKEQKRPVILERPHPAKGAAISSFCGDWEGVAEQPLQTFGRLHLRQSVDGVLTAWLDRSLDPKEHRYGEPLTVVSAVAPSLRLASEGPLGSPYEYSGTLAAYGLRLNGGWREGSAQVPSLRLLALRNFRLLQGCI